MCSRIHRTVRRVTSTLALASALLAGPAMAVPIHCVQDGDTTHCAWSVVQAVEPQTFGPMSDPKAQPVPLCLDCAPVAVEMVCTLVQLKAEPPVVRCEGIADGHVSR